MAAKAASSLGFVLSAAIVRTAEPASPTRLASHARRHRHRTLRARRGHRHRTPTHPTATLAVSTRVALRGIGIVMMGALGRSTASARTRPIASTAALGSLPTTRTPSSHSQSRSRSRVLALLARPRGLHLPPPPWSPCATISVISPRMVTATMADQEPSSQRASSARIATIAAAARASRSALPHPHHPHHRPPPCSPDRRPRHRRPHHLARCHHRPRPPLLRQPAAIARDGATRTRRTSPILRGCRPMPQRECRATRPHSLRTCTPQARSSIWTSTASSHKQTRPRRHPHRPSPPHGACALTNLSATSRSAAATTRVARADSDRGLLPPPIASPVCEAVWCRSPHHRPSAPSQRACASRAPLPPPANYATYAFVHAPSPRDPHRRPRRPQWVAPSVLTRATCDRTGNAMMGAPDPSSTGATAAPTAWTVAYGTRRQARQRRAHLSRHRLRRPRRRR